MAERQAPMSNGHAAPVESAAHANAAALLEVARRVDGLATVSAVAKTSAGETLVKIAPSSDAGTATALTALTAIKVSFPFTTVSALESAVSGTTELHVIVHGTRQEFARALAAVRERRAMKLLLALSRAAFAMGVLSYAAIVYADAILPHA